MKNITIFLLTMLTTTGYCQDIESFLRIKFGSSIDSVKKVLLAKPGCTIDEKNSDSTRLVFDGALFAGRETVFIQFKFVNNKFHTGDAYIKVHQSNQVINIYNQIKSELNEKYYATKEDFETYKNPYKKGDGYEELAIKLGKASFASYWKSKNRSTSENIDNYIGLEITENLSIRISYQDGALVRIASSQQKAQNYADYK